MDPIVFSVLLVIILAVVVGFVLLVLFRASWRVAEPNEALIVSGTRNKDGLGFRIVTGGGTLVTPGLQTVRSLNLGMREAILSTDCVTSQGIQVGIRGVAMFKIGDDPVSIANAARRFLLQDDRVLTNNIQNLFDGHLRSIIGGMTIEDLIKNRDVLTNEARKTVGDDLAKLGLVIDSLQIKDIIDPTKYIENLAAPHVAGVQKAARIAKADADREATQREQEAMAQKADSMRESSIKRAGYQAEVDKASAEAAQAGPLAEAIAKQNVTIAETKTAELNAALAEQDLQAKVRKPADADAYAFRVRAEAQRDAEISQAQAKAKKIELDAFATANATTIIGQAEASAIEIKGKAEGAATKAKLLAEADGIAARGVALAKNQEAVISQTIAELMPQIVTAGASAFNKVEHMMVLDGATGVARGIGNLSGIATTMFPAIRAAVGALKGVVKPQDDA